MHYASAIAGLESPPTSHAHFLPHGGTSSHNPLTASNVLHILQGAFAEMISAILGMFDVKRIRIRWPPREDSSDEVIFSRSRHESHDSRGVQDRKDGNDSGAHGGLVLFSWCVCSKGRVILCCHRSTLLL